MDIKNLRNLIKIESKGRYNVLHLIGRGAIKIILPEYNLDKDFIQRFFQ